MLEIAPIEARPISARIENGARLAIGSPIKRKAVILKIVTTDDLAGFCGTHHARSPAVIAQIINTTLKEIVLPTRADDVVGIWARIYQWQFQSHGKGAAVAMAMSGIDMALWDIRGKAVAWQLHRLLGGTDQPIKAYDGGASRGWQERDQLTDEVRGLVEQGYRAVKLLVGDLCRRRVVLRNLGSS
jgi:D-galactarolactone cycloisomerase